jgi:hypothetical protein
VYQSDWILRQIEMMGVMFRRMLDALRDHRPDEVLDLSDEAIGELMGTDVGLLDSLTGEGLVTFLGIGGEPDVYRMHMLAELLLARAEAHEQLGGTGEADAERGRARALLRAARSEIEDEQQVARVDELLGWLELDGPKPA